MPLKFKLWAEAAAENTREAAAIEKRLMGRIGGEGSELGFAQSNQVHLVGTLSESDVRSRTLLGNLFLVRSQGPAGVFVVKSAAGESEPSDHPKQEGLGINK